MLNADVRQDPMFRLSSFLLPRPLLVSNLADVQAQALRVKVHLIATGRQDVGNTLGVLELP